MSTVKRSAEPIGWAGRVWHVSKVLFVTMARGEPPTLLASLIRSSVSLPASTSESVAYPAGLAVKITSTGFTAIVAKHCGHLAQAC
jgi:hypothetical protein